MPGVGDVLGKRTMRDRYRPMVENKLGTSQVRVHDRCYIGLLDEDFRLR